MEFIGNMSLTFPHNIKFKQVDNSGMIMNFDGVFVEGAVAGRWHNSHDMDMRGRMCLFRISDSIPSDIPPSKN